jgi:hypothetical protein
MLSRLRAVVSKLEVTLSLDRAKPPLQRELLVGFEEEARDGWSDVDKSSSSGDLNVSAALVCKKHLPLLGV